MAPDDELRHLMHVSTANDRPGGAGLVMYDFAATDASEVVDRAREVLTHLVRQAAEVADGGSWPEVAVWRQQLPSWFVKSFEVDSGHIDHSLVDTPLQGADGRTADASDARGRERWTLEAWLTWLEPTEREWWWWDAEHQPGKGHITVEVDGWPYPDGALRWLITSAGADEIDANETTTE